MTSRPHTDPWMLSIYFGETIMLGDIFINFVLAYQEEGDINYIINFKKIAKRYIKEGYFVRDIVIWFPWYLPLGLISPVLEISALIKSIRFN